MVRDEAPVGCRELVAAAGTETEGVCMVVEAEEEGGPLEEAEAAFFIRDGIKEAGRGLAGWQRHDLVEEVVDILLLAVVVVDSLWSLCGWDG